METKALEVSVGPSSKAPSIKIGNRTVIVSGKWMRIATVHDENWLEGEIVEDPKFYIARISESGLKADIFSFSEKIPTTNPRYSYHMEWDNLAVIPTISYADWWEKRLSRKARQEVGRADRRGVSVRVIDLSDEMLHDIVKLFKDIPKKQGVAFAHHAKDFETVKREVSTFADRSEFIGAYYEKEMVGYIKLVHIDNAASIMNLITSDVHYDKRPANALIAKAVKVCEAKGASHLIYGKFVYGNKTSSSLTDFKRRTGFEKLLLPRYYIPLTLKGRTIIRMKLHLGLLGLLPPRVISVLRGLRSMVYRFKDG